jgi:hypothetical protein
LLKRLNLTTMDESIVIEYVNNWYNARKIIWRKGIIHEQVRKPVILIKQYRRNTYYLNCKQDKSTVPHPAKTTKKIRGHMSQIGQIMMVYLIMIKIQSPTRAKSQIYFGKHLKEIKNKPIWTNLDVWYKLLIWHFHEFKRLIILFIVIYNSSFHIIKSKPFCLNIWTNYWHNNNNKWFWSTLLSVCFAY